MLYIRRLQWRMGTTAGACLVVAAMGLMTLAPARAETVRAGAVFALLDAPAMVALERGYFRDVGIELDMQQFASIVNMIPLLSAGHLDVAFSGVTSAAFFNALAQGIPLRIVANQGVARPLSGDRTYYAVVVREQLVRSGAVRRVRDLRGRRVNVVARGSLGQLMVSVALNQDGISLDEVQQEYLGFPEAMAALQSGALDGGWLVEPFITFGRQQGTIRVLASGELLAPGREIADVLFSAAFAAREETARRFMVAYLRGVRDYVRAFFDFRSDPRPVAEALARRLPVRVPELYARMGMPYVDPNGEVNVDDLRAQQEWYVAQSQVTRAVDIRQAVDDRFARHAVSVLGRWEP